MAPLLAGLRKRNLEKKKVVKVPPPPPVPGDFPLSKPGNIATMASLALEFFQVGTRAAERYMNVPVIQTRSRRYQPGDYTVRRCWIEAGWLGDLMVADLCPCGEQMATFPLQNNPYDAPAPTAAAA
jgi:hypothetical protein